MTVLRCCCLLCGMLGAAYPAAPSFAVPAASPLDNPYGRGVHEYFSGSSDQAEQLFSQAIGADPNDPRPYYFRALCLLRMGRGDEARSDMLVGAELEARSPGSYSIGKSLERVQGGDRLTLEAFRRLVRTNRAVLRQARESVLYRAATTAGNDEVALRQKVSVPLDQLIQPVSLNEVVTAPAQPPEPVESVLPPAAQSDPFADDPPPMATGKIPSGKLLGIVGRALLESAPIPSLDEVRSKLPALPTVGPSDTAPAAGPAVESDSDFVPAEGDPFSEPAPDTDEPGQGEEPVESAAEDPFGGF